MMRNLRGPICSNNTIQIYVSGLLECKNGPDGRKFARIVPSDLVEVLFMEVVAGTKN
ncbi:hypothetical protein CRE_22375 [Caenorhabditis remanei]|uniref:Uncharacterized protein n=1 Tax=Caenorhabditis remanei TaxID=31234 RepID=E3MED2_CAERE|nr:hypothetical protein CRE_22375 [Caenorhabditis remanei]